MISAWESAEIGRGVSVLVVKKCHVLLNQCLTDACSKNVIRANPMSGHKAPSPRRAERGALSRADMVRVSDMLVEQTATPLNVSAYLALHLGLRCGETCGLRWGDVDLGKGCVYVRRSIGVADGGTFVKRPKSDAGIRVVYFDSPEVAQVLQARKSVQMLESGGVWPIDDSALYVTGAVLGDYANPTTISRLWSSKANDYGLRCENGSKCTFHALRHTFVSGMDMAKVGERAKQRAAGHADAAMTEHCTHPDEIAQREAAQKLGDFYASVRAGAKGRGAVRQLGRTGTEG